MELLPSFRITANLTVLGNKNTGAVFLATSLAEKTQCSGENRDHIVPIGDLTIKVADPIDLIMKLYEEIKHGDQEHQDWLLNKCKEFLNKNCL